MYKNKSFVEDTIIIFILGVIIFAIYYFFFSPSNKKEINQTIIKEKKEQIIKLNKKEEKSVIKNKTIKIDKDPLENIKKAKELIKEENNNIQIKDNKEDVNFEDKNIEKEINENLTQQSITKSYTDISLFYKDIKTRIYENIKKNVEISNIPNNYAKIRITLLKDGMYEQLKLIDGNKDFFNIIKPSILEVFPLQINDEIKHKFPRYFRMTIK